VPQVPILGPGRASIYPVKVLENRPNGGSQPFTGKRISQRGWFFLHQGNPEAECSPFSGVAFCFDASAVRGKNRPRNGQPHPGTLFLAGRHTLPATIELLKDQGQVDWINAGTAIFYGELQAPVPATAAQRNAPAGRRKARGILEQMAQHAAQQVRIEPGWVVLPFHIENDAMPGQCFA